MHALLLKRSTSTSLPAAVKIINKSPSSHGHSNPEYFSMSVISITQFAHAEGVSLFVTDRSSEVENVVLVLSQFTQQHTKLRAKFAMESVS